MTLPVLVSRIATIVPILFSAHQTLAQESLLPLVDEPSRSELFQLAIRQQPFFEEYRSGRPFVFPDELLEGRIFGIDVSHHNTDATRPNEYLINWQAVADQGAVFSYVKASQGVRYFDPAFESNWESLGNLHESEIIFRGAYHFLSGDPAQSPVQQAQHFLSFLNTDSQAYLPPVLDLEPDLTSDFTDCPVTGRDTRGTTPVCDRWASISAEDIVERVVAWADVVEQQSGCVPIIYTNAYWWEQRVANARNIDKLSRYRMWVARYPLGGDLQSASVSLSSRVPAIWQFTDGAVFSKSVLTTAAGTVVTADKEFDANIVLAPDEFLTGDEECFAVE